MLCDICQGFNIHDLFSLAASRVVEEKPKLAIHGIFPEFQGFPEFYKHQPGLIALRASAGEGCSLCTFIWQHWTRSISPDAVEREWITAGKGGEQIFLGLSKWAPEIQGMPYLTVIQNMPRGTLRDLGMFEVVAKRGNLPRGFEHLLAREIQSSPESDSCTSIAVGWLNDCMTTHRTCQRLNLEDKQLPTRVIEVGSSDGNQEPRLVVADGAHGSWAALSYCWGGDSNFVLKADNMQEMLNGIPLESFPATLRDAVHVTRRLGIRYLWIDALCILQDSSEDWAMEAKRMGNVYRNAKITISAISSPGTEFGMLHDREVAPLSCPLDWNSRKDEELTKVYLRSFSHSGDLNMKSSPLNTRGWSLQEALLSARTISYGPHQMIWECQECRIDEGGRPAAPAEKYRDKKFIQSLISAKVNSKKRAILRRAAAISFQKYLNLWTLEFQKPYNRWFDIVIEYTSRSLTVATDVLPALSGLAKAFQNLLGDRYCAGLWADDILRGLMWMRPQANSRAPLTRQLHYTAPSWSWASLSAPKVSFQYPPMNIYCEIEEQAKVLEVSTAPRSEDPFGQIKGGYIVIQGSYYDVQDPRIENISTSTPLLQSKLRAVATDRHAEFNQQHHEHEGQRFGLLLLAKSFTESGIPEREGRTKWTKSTRFIFLLVETTGMLENEYRRVGLIIVHGDRIFNPAGEPLFEEVRKAEGKKRKIRLV